MKIRFTKKTAMAFIAASVLCTTGFAQQAAKSDASDEGKNLIKINLPSLAMKTVHVQYERAIGGKTSVGIGLRMMPKGTLPFGSSLETIDDQLGSLEMGNFAITPEVKFYMGKGVFKGFYIAPFLKYANYNVSINYEYGDEGEKIPLAGKLDTYTAGVLFGAQWRLAKKFYLDWSIFGPQYGISKGNLTGKKALDAEEQENLREGLNDIDLPVGKVTSTVNANGATVDLKGPWAGIRANIGIGYRF